MNRKVLGLFVALGIVSSGAHAFTLKISGDQGVPGERVQSQTCELAGEDAFTSSAGGTYYTKEQVYSGAGALELNIMEGQKGFGTLGGILRFANCAHAGGRNVVKGEGIWVRLRIKFPVGFEFNQNGRNKFLRLRTFHEDAGVKVSEGYNDLYLDAPPGVDSKYGYTPFDFIFEGAQRWYYGGKDFLKLGEWNTIEYYIRLDDKSALEGGESLVRIWHNGVLVGETRERNTLTRPDSYVESLYLFTYWDNEGAHITQKFWVDDIVLTTDEPAARDAAGNPYVGLGDGPVGDESAAPPSAPDYLSVD